MADNNPQAQSVPAPVQAQLDLLNVHVNSLITDRERVVAWFDDELGNSVWNLLSAANKTAARNALVAHMQSAVNGIQDVIDALAVM